MNLCKVVSSVQNVSEAIASVIKVDVTIVDHHLNRIAGTGRYQGQIGETVDENSAFGFVLRHGESLIIENPRQHGICLQCDNIDNCVEYAEVCCPIKVKDEIVGVIGLIAFEEDQRTAMIGNQHNLMKFLDKMADLISSKVIEQESTDQIKLLARELETVLNSVDRGIIAVDETGKIIRYNKTAIGLFKLEENKVCHMNIKDLLGQLDLEVFIKQNRQVKNREFVYRGNGDRLRGVFDANPINIGSENFGIVFTFSNISDVLGIINDMTTGTMSLGFDDIIGDSQLFNEVKLEGKKAAQSTSTVLIQGESGTGKELFARAIHFHSQRRQKPFIPINCAAIPEQLLESELFGYEEGAFTGAKRGGKSGKFELANGGTIFLDEIGDMPLHLQTKFLRVLQEQVIEKVGGKEFIPIDARIIAATNKDLESSVLEGAFRQDLFYRINVIPLYIPPLRQRGEDLMILVNYLLKKCNDKLGKDIHEVHPEVLDVFRGHQWPGNVRELENTIEYAVNMCTGSIIMEGDLPQRLSRREVGPKEELPWGITSIKELEKKEIEKAIAYFGDTKQAITEAATALGIGRATLYRKLKLYGIKTVSK